MTEYTGVAVGVIDDDKEYVDSLSTKISSVVAKTVGGNSDFDNLLKSNLIVDGETLILEAAPPKEATWSHDLIGQSSSLILPYPHETISASQVRCSLTGIDNFLYPTDRFYSSNLTGATITRSGSTATVQHESWVSPANAGSVCGGSGGNTIDSNPFTIWSHELDEIHGIGYALPVFYYKSTMQFYGTTNGIRIYFGGVLSSGWNVDVKVSMVSIADAMTSSVVASFLVDGEEGWKEVSYTPVDTRYIYLEITPVDASGFLYDFIECQVHMTTPCSMINGDMVRIKYADQPEYNGLFSVSMPTQTSGTLEVGRLYKITQYNYSPLGPNDDFSNVGGPSWPGEEYKNQDAEFIATGTTPTYWGNGSRLERLDRTSYDIAVSGTPVSPATSQTAISANPDGSVYLSINTGETVIIGDYVGIAGGGAFFHIGFDFYYSPSSKTILELLDDGGAVRWSNTAGTNVPILPVSVYSVCGQDGTFPAVNAIDTSTSTQWKHSDSDPHVIIFDMGDNYDTSGSYFYYNGGNSTGWSVVLTMSTTPDNFTGPSASFTINGSAGYKTINFNSHLYGRYAQLYISPIQANGNLQDFGMFKMFIGARVELDMPSTSWLFRIRAISAGTMTANSAKISNISMTGYKPYGLAKSLPYSVPTLDLAEIYYYKFFNSCDVLPIHAQISFSDDGDTWSPFIGPDGTPDTTYTTSWTDISVASGYTGYYFKWRVYFISTGEYSPILNTVSLWLMMILYGMPLLSIDDPDFSQAASPVMGDGLLLPSSSAGTFLQYNHIPAITRVTSTATAFQTSHKLVTGDYVEISGADQSEYNGIFRVTVIDDSHYTYTVTGTPATPATGVTSSYPISWSNWAAVTEITRAGTVATVHQPGNGFVTNDWVKIIGADQSQYNGLFKITRTDNNYYTFTVAGSPASPATGSIYSTLHSDWLGLALSPGTAFLQTANGELADVIISISISTRGTNLGAELSGQDWEARILPFISTWLESVVGQVLSGYVKDQYEELILDGINVIINSSYAFGLDKMGVVDSVTGFFQVFVGPTIYDGRFLITKLSNGKTFDVSYRKDGTPDLIDGTVPIITPQDLHFWKPGQICGKSVAFVGSLVTY